MNQNENSQKGSDNLPPSAVLPAATCSLRVLEDIWKWVAAQWHDAAEEVGKWRQAGAGAMVIRCEGKKTAWGDMKKEIMRRMKAESLECSHGENPEK